MLTKDKEQMTDNTFKNGLYRKLKKEM